MSLSLNRALSLISSKWTDTLFHSWRVYIWIACSFLYGAIFLAIFLTNAIVVYHSGLCFWLIIGTSFNSVR